MSDIILSDYEIYVVGLNNNQADMLVCIGGRILVLSIDVRIERRQLHVPLVKNWITSSSSSRDEPIVHFQFYYLDTGEIIKPAISDAMVVSEYLKEFRVPSGIIISASNGSADVSDRFERIGASI